MKSKVLSRIFGVLL